MRVYGLILFFHLIFYGCLPQQLFDQYNLTEASSQNQDANSGIIPPNIVSSNSATESAYQSSSYINSGLNTNPHFFNLKAIVIFNDTPEDENKEFEKIKTLLWKVGFKQIDMTYDTDIYSYEQIKNYDLVILHDMGWHSGYPLEAAAVEAVIKFRNSGKPVMVLGDDIACQIKNTPKVAELIKVTGCVSNGPHFVTITPTGKELVNIWGNLEEYVYYGDIDTIDKNTAPVTVWMTSSNGPVAYTYVQRGPVAVYRQNILDNIGDSHPAEIVFKNLVSWLIKSSSTDISFYSSQIIYKILETSFEEYLPGSLPDGFVIIYDGKGEKYQSVVDTISYTGLKSLRVWGVPGWCANLDYNFDVFNYKKIEVSLKIYSTENNNGWISFINKDGATWGWGWCFVGLYPKEGKYKISYTDLDGNKVNEYIGPDKLPLRTNDWNDIKILMDTQTTYCEVYLNGYKLYEATLDLNSGWIEYKYYFLDGTTKVYRALNSNPSAYHGIHGIRLGDCPGEDGGEDVPTYFDDLKIIGYK